MSAVVPHAINNYLPASGDEEFDYRPMPVLVPISVGLTFAAFSAFLWEPLVIVAALAVLVSAWAYRVVRKAPDAWSGGGVALGCLAVQALVGLGAGTLHAYSYAVEVPDGFRRINFASDISEKGLENRDGVAAPPAAVKALDGQPVFVKGYMYPSKQMHGIASFILCKDSGDCCFGGQPAPTDMIVVQMPADQGASFRTGLMAVAGTFRAAAQVDADGLRPIYQIDAKYFGPAMTSY